ncbi:isoflavone reductase family protein [Xylariaceae sp. FL0662B]|nr:isoflavone reductase family protein [Xylariaceae sp. FL0662B]
MATSTKVAVVGATGRTGNTVVNGLLASETNFDITGLTRPSSINSDANKSLEMKGIHVVAADLTGPKEELVKALAGIEIVISCIYFRNLQDQIPLAAAAKDAGVKRFVPCAFGTPAPRGVMAMADEKDDILAAIQRLYVPYTVIDVGWWSNQAIPRLTSGRTDHEVIKILDAFIGDGAVPIAYTDLSDIGTYVAKIIMDPRTLNKKVFAYTEVLTLTQVVDLMEELSGEKVLKNYLSPEEIHKNIADALVALKKDPLDSNAKFALAVNQYFDCWAVRGDNTPSVAAYLGYLDFKQLYPDVRGKTMRALFQEVLDGQPTGIRYS